MLTFVVLVACDALTAAATALSATFCALSAADAIKYDGGGFAGGFGSFAATKPGGGGFGGGFGSAAALKCGKHDEDDASPCAERELSNRKASYTNSSEKSSSSSALHSLTNGAIMDSQKTY